MNFSSELRIGRSWGRLPATRSWTAASAVCTAIGAALDAGGRLARKTGASRSRKAARFAALLGSTPIFYLRERLALLLSRERRTGGDVPIAHLAIKAGYAPEEAPLRAIAGGLDGCVKHTDKQRRLDIRSLRSASFRR